MRPEEQSAGRRKNAASPAGKSTPDASDEAARRVGRESRRRAGPDGPDAREIGDTFKAAPEQSVAGVKRQPQT